MSSWADQWGWAAFSSTQSLPERLARVLAVDRETCVLVSVDGVCRGVVSGRYRHQHPDTAAWPAVGDWVGLEPQASDGLALIGSVLARKTELGRLAPGSSQQRQVIAANVDVAIIVQSCHADFNIRRLERYLVMVREGGILPRIVLTKADLVTDEAREAMRASVLSLAGVASLDVLSLMDGHGLAAFRQKLVAGQTFCLIGSSGVGKSTLINRLSGVPLQETAAVSATGEGRHTTVRRALIRISGGALLLDTPGMRELGVAGAEEGVAQQFSAVEALARCCRFRDCQHQQEPGCAVRAAAARGDLEPSTLVHYRQLAAEAAFANMNEVERRHKARTFGRFLKQAKKSIGEGAAPDFP